MSLTTDQIQEAINIHLDLQIGTYLTSVVSGKHASYAYSELVSDFYWNYAIQLHAKNRKEIDDLLTSASEFFATRGLSPCFYVDPTSVPRNFGTQLPSYNHSSEVWMFYSGSADIQISNGLRIRHVESLEDMQAFIDTFNQVYGGDVAEGEGYGGLSPAYGQALLNAFKSTRSGHNTVHYLGYLDKEIVGIASLYSDGTHGGIYNVGTVPTARSQGIGSALSMQAITESQKMNHKYLFLQTEQGSSVERFYKRLGFITEFVGEFYYRS